MWKIFKQSEDAKDETQFQSVVDQIKIVSEEVSLSDYQKSSMKSSLMALVSDDDLVPSDLKNVESAVKSFSREDFLKERQKKFMYQQILDSIQTRVNFWVLFFQFFRGWRAGVASVVIFTMILGLFVVAPFELRVTRAAKWTFLESVLGEVYVNRDGKVMHVDKDFAISEGDLVFTRDDSAVTIRYLDDSVTRLGPNTSLEIKKLYVRPDNAVQTKVELSLLGGQLWASVYNLIDSDSSFVIETGNARADVSSRAAFELKSLEHVTVLSVFDNVVDLTKTTSDADYIQPVVAGFKAEISSSPFRVLKNDVISVEKIKSPGDKWVATNLELDQLHQDKLKEENLEFVADSVHSDQTLGLLADFKDSTKALFANTDIESARQRFIAVHLGFIKAQDLLENASRENDYRHQATPLLIQYQTAIREITASFDHLSEIDPKQADLLISHMREEVDIQRKALSLVLPNEKLYTAKEVVMESAGYFATDSAERAVYLLDCAKNRLMEMQGLIAENDLKGAEASFRAYLRGIDDLVQEVEDSQVVEIEKNLFVLLNEQIAQLKQLTAIESALLEKNDKKFAALVASVKEDSLRQLLRVVKVYRKDGVPFQFVMDLRSTADEYFPDSLEKSRILKELDVVLADYPEYASFAKTVDVTKGDVIVDFEASRDLGICELNCAKEQSQNTEEST